MTQPLIETANLDDLRRGFASTKGTQSPYGLHNIAGTMEAYLKVRPEEGGLVPFVHRPVQRQFVNYVQLCWNEGRPCWIVVLKSRRHGISTEVQGIQTVFTIYTNNNEYLTLAHCDPSAKTIFDMQIRFHRELPDEVRPPLAGGKKTSKDHLTLAAPWYNISKVLTAGGAPVAGPGYQIIHASEMALWTQASIQMEALSKCITKRPKFSIFVIESTPNGLGEFKYYCDLAQNPQSPWKFFFFPWMEDKECRLEPPPNFELTGEEQAYKDLIQRDAKDKDGNPVILDDWQMNWVRRTLEDQCGGRWEEFHRQYAGTVALAFLSSANYVFNQHLIANQIRVVTPQFNEDGTQQPAEIQPVFTGDIWFEETTPTIPKLIPDPKGPLKIYEHPDPEVQKAGLCYCGGVDTGKGKQLDDSATIILRPEPLRTAAVYKDDSTEAQRYAMKMYLLGLYYFNAFLVLDPIGLGETTVGMFEHGFTQAPWAVNWATQIDRYPNLYSEVRLNRKTMKQEDAIGYHTTKSKRERMVYGLAEIFGSGNLAILDLNMLQQFQGLVVTPKVFVTRKGAISQDDVFEQSFREPGAVKAKDDLIMAAALANQGILFAPRQVAMDTCPRAERRHW